MSKITVTTIAGLTSGGDANTVKIESGDAFQVVSGATTLGGATTVSGDLTVDTSTLKVDSSNNRVGIGTASPSTTLTVVDDVSIEGSTPTFQMADTDVSTNVMTFTYDEQLTVAIDPNNARGSTGLILTQDGNEVLRTDSSRRLLIGNTSYDSSSKGALINSVSGKGFFTVGSDAPLAIHRLNNDGNLVELRQDNNTEGTISVSGSTVSYNGFSGLHESSGIATDTPIGTVVSTIDELDVYSANQNGMDGEEVDSPKAGKPRADHAKVEVSDTVGDSAVYGVVSNFNEQGKVNVASVGIGSVRVTGACSKGDLLESNGDGTAKVQSDDIVRSKTIGKVTIGNNSSSVKLVSCVLYCG